MLYLHTALLDLPIVRHVRNLSTFADRFARFRLHAGLHFIAAAMQTMVWNPISGDVSVEQSHMGVLSRN